jgi:hypothetical protein
MGYNRKEMEEVSLDVLISPSLRTFHNKIFNEWITSGKCNNEEAY